MQLILCLLCSKQIKPPGARSVCSNDRVTRSVQTQCGRCASRRDHRLKKNHILLSVGPTLGYKAIEGPRRRVSWMLDTLGQYTGTYPSQGCVWAPLNSMLDCSASLKVSEVKCRVRCENRDVSVPDVGPLRRESGGFLSDSLRHCLCSEAVITDHSRLNGADIHLDGGLRALARAHTHTITHTPLSLSLSACALSVG